MQAIFTPPFLFALMPKEGRSRHPFVGALVRCAIGMIALGLQFLSCASAQPSGNLLQPHRMVDVHPAVRISSLAMAANVDSALVLDQILALPANAFTELPVGELEVRDPSLGRSMWLRITVRAHEAIAQKLPSPTTILEIQKPYLDRLTLYRPPSAAGGAWQVQRAGDYLPSEAWSLAGQFPRFLLPTRSELRDMPGEQIVLYLHVPHRTAASFRLKVWSATDLMSRVQFDYLLLGITFGALLFAVMLSIGLLIFHRDRLFVWYALYALSALFVCLSHAGIANQYLWPWGGPWPTNATNIFMLLVATSHLQFCKLLFMSSSQKLWPIRFCEGVGVLNVSIALTLLLVSDQYWTSVLLVAQAMVVVSMFASCAVIAATWRHKNKLALALVLTYLPLIFTIVLSLLDFQGLLKLPDMGYSAPIFAVALEVILLGLCLQWFGHARHGKIEHSRALASTDPLTGFLSASSFHQLTRKSWDVSSKSATDTAIVYVSLRNANADKQRLESLLLRSVRILRAATANQDIVGRLDGRLLALLLPSSTMGEKLSERLSRIIALGLMPDSSDTKGEALQFRIAYTTRKHYKYDAARLDQDLRELLAEEKRWASRPIRVIDHRKNADPRPREVIDTSGLQDKWDQALAAAKEHPSAINVPLTNDPSPR